MAQVTDPIILDSTGQAIKNSIDLLSANINRTASNIPYDSNLTIKAAIDGKVSKAGDTITGDLFVQKSSGDSNVVLGGNSSRGVSRYYDETGHFVDVYPNTLTTNRAITLPDKNGTMALTSDLSNDVVAIDDFTTSDGRYYTRRFTTISRSRFPFIIFRIRQGGAISNPSIVVGAVDNQDSTLVMNFSDSSVTFDSSTQTITVDMLGSAWTYPVIFVKKGYLE